MGKYHLEPLKQQLNVEDVLFLLTLIKSSKKIMQLNTSDCTGDVLDAVVLQVLYLQQAEVTRERVYAMHQSSIDGVEDMSALAELHEAAIMHNLYQRYQKDNIYVSVFG